MHAKQEPSWFAYMVELHTSRYVYSYHIYLVSIVIVYQLLSCITTQCLKIMLKGKSFVAPLKKKLMTARLLLKFT